VLAALPLPLITTAAVAAAEDPKTLISAGRFGEAQAQLEQRVMAGVHDTETYFLLGRIAVERDDYRKAIHWFRMALVRDPGSARLRLELGRALYLVKDYANAELQFQRALAGNLPAPVQANARRFLDRIRREKRWSYTFGLAVAPDTNVNAGSSASETIIFGLPFELGPEARMHSGIGFIANSSIEFSPRLTHRLRWQVGADIRRTDYQGTRFDETIADGWSGPQWFGKNIELSAAATSLRRWYGGALYQRALGGRVEAVAYLGPRTALLLGASAQRFDYPTFPQQNGPVWSISAGVARVLDPTTSITFLVNAAAQDARTPDLSNRSGIVSLSATRDFQGGFTVTINPAYAFADYRAPDAFFGMRRHDRSKELRLILLNRRAAIWRFTPTITYTRLRRTSSINIYNSSQDRVQLGLTSSF
jgi:tetratricopeptide (TPR) repeat protein